MTSNLQLLTALDTPPTLAGSRSVLRALRAGDAPALQRHADDEAVRGNLFEGFPGPYTLADAQAWCGYRLEATMPQSAIKDGRVIDRVVYARYRQDIAA
ncbi:MAG: hypothetical protein H7322_05905 [Ramlibacter sp.]|nr:hypothetical protein [Ramlibacter sp.]